MKIINRTNIKTKGERMDSTKFYSLPALPYDYNVLEPVISAKLLTIHHDMHHKAYVDGANEILEKMDKTHAEGAEQEMKGLLKSLSFNVGGHVLHGLFWDNLRAKSDGNMPKGSLKSALEEEFGSFEKFKEEFSKTAMTVEGSGWAVLTFCKKTKRPILMQAEKHNVNIYPTFGILLVLDVWEHAYYLDYENKRKDFIDAFWGIVNWDEVEKRLKELM
jgi:Fe-Mn family superoxide dismutase